jgi:uncharacterized protein (TIGR02594 family)
MRRSAFAFLGIFVLTVSLPVSIQTASATGKTNKPAEEKNSPTLYLQTAGKPAKAAVTRISTANLGITQTTPVGKPKKTEGEKSSSQLVNEARRWIGTNPTGWNHVWCARFMNFVLRRLGYEGTGSDAASSFAHYGRRIWWPQEGAIAVMTRGKNGGHVGVVAVVANDGKIIVISGNHNKKVGVGHYPRERIYAYVLPT